MYLQGLELRIRPRSRAYARRLGPYDAFPDLVRVLRVRVTSCSIALRQRVTVLQSINDHSIYAKVCEESSLVWDNSVAHRTAEPTTGPRSPRRYRRPRKASHATRCTLDDIDSRTPMRCVGRLLVASPVPLSWHVCGYLGEGHVYNPSSPSQIPTFLKVIHSSSVTTLSKMSSNYITKVAIVGVSLSPIAAPRPSLYMYPLQC